MGAKSLVSLILAPIVGLGWLSRGWEEINMEFWSEESPMVFYFALKNEWKVDMEA